MHPALQRGMDTNGLTLVQETVTCSDGPVGHVSKTIGESDRPYAGGYSSSGFLRLWSERERRCPGRFHCSTAKRRNSPTERIPEVKSHANKH